MKKSGYTSTTAAEKLGISVSQFKTLVKKFNIEPEKYVVNSMRMNTKIAIYTETSVEFLIDYISKNRSLFIKRSEAAKKAIQTKTKLTIELFNDWEPNIPIIDFKILLKDAINAYNDWNYLKSDVDLATLNSDKHFLARITKNFLRHECSDYDYKLEEMKGLVGNSQAYLMVNERVNKEIDKKYPMLLSLNW